MEETHIYKEAQRRVTAKLAFFKHLTVYIVVNLLLIAINMISSPGYYWFVWPLMGWGVGLAFHALGAFMRFGGSDLKKRMIEKEMEKLRGNNMS